MSSKLGKGKLGIAVIFKLLTGLKGDAVFILDEKNAFKLISMSHKTKDDEKKFGCPYRGGIISVKGNR